MSNLYVSAQAFVKIMSAGLEDYLQSKGCSKKGEFVIFLDVWMVIR